MAYRTGFSLEIIENNSDIDNAVIMTDLTWPGSEAGYAIDVWGYTANRTTWNDHERDIAEFSKKYPKVLFALHGEGDDEEDLWKLYVKNGKVQYAQGRITYEHYDESKLREPEGGYIE